MKSRYVSVFVPLSDGTLSTVTMTGPALVMVKEGAKCKRKLAKADKAQPWFKCMASDALKIESVVGMVVATHVVGGLFRGGMMVRDAHQLIESMAPARRPGRRA